MATFRRDTTTGGTWFFTVVTAGRMPWLSSIEPVRGLRAAIGEVRTRLPFRIDAAVILPDHLHMIWTLPTGDADFGRRWGMIKRAVARATPAPGAATRTRSQGLRHESGLWQRRFREHRIRDAGDMQRHVDCIHFNPVKHGRAERASAWPWSSIHVHIRRGWIRPDWAAGPDDEGKRFGE